MEITLWIVSIPLIAAIILLCIKLQNINSDKSVLLERNKNLDEQLHEQNDKVGFLEDRNSQLSVIKGRFDQSETIISDLKSQNYQDEQELKSLRQKINEFEKQNELLKQQQANIQKERDDWSSDKEVILNKLSEELIKKNNEEQNKISVNQQESIKKTTEELFKNFEGVLNKVSSLNDDVKKSTDDINLTKNALLNPGGAGRTAEITLENILKSSGLKEKSNINDPGDFILQSHFTGIDKYGKRPDALVFLPSNHILIIDSKSSSHFLELQKAIDSKNPKLQKEVVAKIKDSMKKHLEDLKKKDYAKAKLEELDLQNILKSKDAPIITTIMFLQTEKMLDIVRNADGNFEQKALEANIQILSPVGLINLLYQAKFLIDRVCQEENIEKLRIEIKKLIDSLATMFSKSEDLGKSIGKTMKSYNEFVGTFNNRFLPRIVNMNKFGIKFDKKNVVNKLKKIESRSDLIEIDPVELVIDPVELGIANEGGADKS